MPKLTLNPGAIWEDGILHVFGSVPRKLRDHCMMKVNIKLKCRQSFREADIHFFINKGRYLMYEAKLSLPSSITIDAMRFFAQDIRDSWKHYCNTLIKKKK